MDTPADTKEMTLENLALMVAKGFEDVQGQITDVRSTMATKDDITSLRTEMAEMKTELKTEIEGLRNSVNNYLTLSDTRYLELKRQNEIYAKWFKALAEKVNLDLNFAELTKL